MKNKDILGTKDNKETSMIGMMWLVLEAPSVLIIREEALPGVGTSSMRIVCSESKITLDQYRVNQGLLIEM